MTFENHYKILDFTCYKICLHVWLPRLLDSYHICEVGDTKKSLVTNSS